MDTSVKNRTTVDEILLLLPQTQCGHCGFDNCRAYAEAIAENRAGIDRCSTGGQSGIRQLASLLNVAEPLLDCSFGMEKPRTVAYIDESKCTGCTLCIQACPVDAIVGTGKMMHTVIGTCCTGCERCIPVCPLECIGLKTVSGTKTGWDAWSAEQAKQARERYERRLHRLQTENGNGQPAAARESKKSDILKKVMERARARSGKAGTNS